MELRVSDFGSTSPILGPLTVPLFKLSSGRLEAPEGPPPLTGAGIFYSRSPVPTRRLLPIPGAPCRAHSHRHNRLETFQRALRPWWACCALGRTALSRLGILGTVSQKWRDLFSIHLLPFTLSPEHFQGYIKVERTVR